MRAINPEREPYRSLLAEDAIKLAMPPPSRLNKPCVGIYPQSHRVALFALAEGQVEHLLGQDRSRIWQGHAICGVGGSFRNVARQAVALIGAQVAW